MSNPQAFPVLAFQDFIDANGEHLTTDSLRVAKAHGKRHDNVVALIRKRMADAGEWGLLNFKESSYLNEQNKLQPMFTMTQAGYQFLVGKMTGKKAVQHQIAYINAFEAMRALIKNQREGLQYRMAKHDLDVSDSKRRGHIHGRGLYQRKREIPLLEAEGAELKALAQSVLFPAVGTVQ